MTLTTQFSLVTGEVDESLAARYELPKRNTALKYCSNFFIKPQGGISNRSGLEYVGDLKDQTKEGALLMPFDFGLGQTYMIEFGEKYARFYRNGSRIFSADKAIVGVALGNPVVITLPSHGYSSGDWAFINGLTGASELSNRMYRVSSATANTFELQDTLGNDIDGTGLEPYASGGVAAKVYEIETPYTLANVAEMNGRSFAQSGDVITIVHHLNPVYDLKRFGNTNWTITPKFFTPAISSPTNLSASASGSGGSPTTYEYRATSISDDNKEESLPSNSDSATVDLGLEGNVINLTWTQVSGASRYNVYKAKNGVYGFIGVAQGGSFTDDNIVPSESNSPPDARNPFNSPGNYPSTVNYNKQRLVYANTDNKPEWFFTSRLGIYDNMTTSFPAQDDDAINVSPAGGKNYRIYSIVDMEHMVLLTSGRETVVKGNADGIITPAAGGLNITHQSYHGSAEVAPITVGKSVLFVQNGGAKVYDFGFNWQADGYNGDDLTILAPHLFEDEGDKIADWSYAKLPHSIVWCRRFNGTGLIFTYLREHQVFAWSRFETKGKLEAISTVREVNDDILYTIIKRTINGQVRRYVERLRPRKDLEVRDAFFVDAGLSYDFLTQIQDITLANPVQITSTSHGYADGSLVDISDCDGADELNYSRYVVANATNDTFTLKDEEGNDIDGTGFKRYEEGGVLRKPISKLSGLSHLEGEEVVAVADGNVQFNLIVQNGAIEIPFKASRIHVGLSYAAEAETLSFVVNEGSSIGKKKRIPNVRLRVNRTRGVSVGSNRKKLFEIKERTTEEPNKPTELQTFTKKVDINGGWGDEPTVIMRQEYPLPVTILGITPEIIVGN